MTTIDERLTLIRKNLNELEQAGAPEGLISALRSLIEEVSQTHEEGLEHLEQQQAQMLGDQRRVEEGLRRERHFVERLVDTAQAIIVVLDTQGRIVLFNPYLEELSGFKLDDVRGEDWFSTFLPTRDHERIRELFQRAVGDMDVRGKVNSIVTREGVERQVEWYGKSLKDGEGNVIGHIAVGQDITDRLEQQEQLRQSEEMLRRAQAIAQMGSAWAVPPFGRDNVQWSEEMYRILGRDPSDGPLSPEEVLDQVVHPEDREWVRRAFEEALGENRILDTEFRIQRPDGSVRRVCNISQPEVDASGRLQRRILTLRDVTEQRELERHYRHAQKMEAVGTLTSGIAHDYNNQLMGILGCLEVVLQADTIDAARPYLEGAKEAAKRGAALTRQLLTFSRQREGSPSDVDVNEAIRQAEQMIRALVGESIELRISLTKRGWLTRIDPGQIDQVLMNLVLNARDAMPDGGVLTLVASEVVLSPDDPRARGVLSAGEYVTLSVTDTGIGMDAATQERIFEPFFTTKEVGKGTGLGLSTVYGIVQHSGGYVDMTSAAGRGTTFTVYLPRAPSAGDSVRSPSPPEPSGEGSEKVLLVEDEPLVRLAVRAYLEPHGYRVVEAAEPAEASLAVSQASESFDLLLTDVMLPKMTGRQLAEQVQSSSPHTKVLFMSAHPEAALRDTGKIPSNAYALQKPFTEGELTRMVRRVLGEPRQERPVDKERRRVVQVPEPTRTKTLLLVEDEETARKALVELLGACGYRVLAAPGANEALDILRAEREPIDALLSDIGLPDGKLHHLLQHLRSTRKDAAVLFISGRSEHDPLVRELLAAPNTAYLQKPVDIEALDSQVSQLLKPS